MEMPKKYELKLKRCCRLQTNQILRKIIDIIYYKK